MRKHYLLLLFYLLAGIYSYSAQAQDGTSTRVYGYQMGDENLSFGFISFPIDDWANPKVEKKVSGGEPHICAAEYFDGRIYAYKVEADDYGNLYPESYEIYDAETYAKLERKETISYFMHDMAYDYTTNTMYGLVEMEENASKLEKANLCIIDMETGTYRVVGDVGNNLTGGALVTLACDSKGDLYAMSEYRCFYKINRNTGVATQVGEQHKLAVINSFQSMAFDTADHLYWAQQTPDYGWFTSIDHVTGVPTKLGTLGANAQVSGLYFKRDVNKKLPAKISSLAVVTDPSDPFSLSFSWTNPSKTYGGEDLTSLTGIYIYRIGTSELVADIKVSDIGKAMKYTDKVTKSGKQLYKILPYNSDGVGFPVFIEIFSGYDQPKEVKNLETVLDDKVVSLSWEAPTEAVNGGYVNFDQLTYNVYRVRGVNEQLVSEKQSGTTFTEALTDLGLYSYKIAAVAGDVVGLLTQSKELLIKGVASIPYLSGFEKTEDVDLWKMVNHNTSVGWSIGSGYGALSGAFAQCKTGGSSAGPADDWLISPPIHMEPGVYLLSYYTSGGYSDNNYDVAIGTSDIPQSLTQILKEVRNYSGSDWTKMEIRIPITVAGDYHFAWHGTTTSTYAALKVDNVSVTLIPDFDASLKAIYVPVPTDKLNEHSPVSVLVENRGVQSFSKFEVTAQTSYKTQAKEVVEREVLPGETFVYQLKNGVDFSEFGLHAVRAWIDLEGDNIAVNDTTQVTFTYHVKPAEIPFEIGFEADESEEMFGWTTSNDAVTEKQGWIVPVANVAHIGKQSMGYKSSSSKPADHWVYSKAMKLKAGQTYNLTYYVSNKTASKTNIWTVAFGMEQTPEGMSNIINEQTYSGAASAWKKVEQLFTPTQEGVYYLSWHLTSAANMGDFCIDDISVTAIKEQDLVIEKAITVVPLNNTTAIKVILKNSGAKKLDSYTLSYQVNGENVITEQVTEAIEPLAISEYVFTGKTDMAAYRSYDVVVKGSVAGTSDISSEYIFSVNRSGAYDLDFEFCDDFENSKFVTNQNQMWTSIDGDKANTYKIGTYVYPHVGEPTALLAFNPELVTPSLGDSNSFGMSEEGGKRYGMFMSVNYTTCDDWLISPKVKVLDEDATFSMLSRDVRSTAADIADFYIEIATTENQPLASDFKKLTPEISHVSPQWNTYTYQLGDYVGKSVWIAIHHVSKMKYAFLVDNLKFTGCEGSVPTSIQQTSIKTMTLTPNPSDGYCELMSETPVVAYRIYDMQGRAVKVAEHLSGTRITLDVASLPKGLYQVCVTDIDNNRQTLKLLRK